MEFEYIANMNIESLKKKLRRYNFEEFSKEIERIKVTQDEIDRVLNKTEFKVGLFVLDTE